MALCEYRWTGMWGVDLGEPGVASRPVEVAHVCVKDAGHIERHACHCGAKSSSGIAAPEPRIGLLCTYQPNPAEIVTRACPQCGHLLAAHVGEEKCPVCVLVWHGTEQWMRQEARKRGLRWPV